MPWSGDICAVVGEPLSDEALALRLRIFDMIIAHAQAPWGITFETLDWLAALAHAQNVSDKLLVVTIRDADTTRRFEGEFDFSISHFVHIMAESAETQQRRLDRAK